MNAFLVDIIAYRSSQQFKIKVARLVN